MKKNIIFIMLVLLAACSPMNDKYKDFIKDGPIVYLSKLNTDEVKVTGNRERIHFQWPALTDPRGKKVIISWANKTEKLETEFDPSVPTSIYVGPLREGSYIFEINIIDNEGNSSIPVFVTGYSYGLFYESYLINRKILSSALVEKGRTVTCPAAIDSTMTGMVFEWMDATQTIYTGFIPSSDTIGTLAGCNSLSFRYHTEYSPEKGEDLFYAPWQYYLENALPNNISFDYNTKKVVFPKPNDGYWTGYEIQWIDRVTGEEKSYNLAGNEGVIPDYNGRSFTYYTLFNIDEEKQLSSSGNAFLTATYVDLKRTNWYAASETDLDNNPILNVNFGSAPAGITAGPTAVSTINNKKKSAYLSHLLPYANATLSTTSGDGVNCPSAHFDNNSMTYLSMVKGIGIDATNNNSPDPLPSTWYHVNGGVTITAENDKPWFIIRLDQTQPQKFNYFRMRYRENGSNGSGLKPQGITLFGSNDDSCITDATKWTKINTEVIVPPGSTTASTQPPAANMGIFASGANLESGNVMLPSIVTYRYVKVQYDKWEVGSNTIQVAEFWLGLYD
jgi:hypothetical protein